MIPLIINAGINYSGNEDIWYVMKYGEIILQKGFIHIDVLSIHSGLHIVIQQGFSNIIFYLIYKCLGDFGLFLLCELFVALYLFIIYKICILLSNKKEFVSIVLACITCILLEYNFISPRPQLFTYFHILLIIYIMEIFYKNNKTKFIYLLPLISLVQINLHAALWIILFIFMLPYIAQLIIQKNKNVFKLFLMMILMFLVGFINPYTYENVFFPFMTYSSEINKYILELFPVNIVSTEYCIRFISVFFYILLALELLIYIYYKKGKLELRHLLLFGGTTILALTNIRNIAFFIIVTIPILSNYLKGLDIKVDDKYIDTKKYWIILIIVTLVVGLSNTNRLESRVKKGGDFLKENYNQDLILYTNLDYGSYLEYLGFHSFMDTRAEVFMKKANKKADYFVEAMEVEDYCINYKSFIEKYHFTHMVINKDSCFYYYLIQDNTKVVFEEDKYVIFELNYD